MIALGVVLALIGTGLAWGGPTDPNNPDDWFQFGTGLALCVLGGLLVAWGT